MGKFEIEWYRLRFALGFFSLQFGVVGWLSAFFLYNFEDSVDGIRFGVFGQGTL